MTNPIHIRLTRTRVMVSISGVLLLGAAVATYIVHSVERQIDAQEKWMSAPNLYEEQRHPLPRARYPYAVYPPGVYSGAEYDQAVRDPLIAKHYAGLQFVRMGYAPYPKMYALYRLHDQIYWTSTPVRVMVGETVALMFNEKNGDMEYIRSRCGNRLSLTPRFPILPPAKEKPILEAMEREDNELNNVPMVPFEFEVPAAPGTGKPVAKVVPGSEVWLPAYPAVLPSLQGYAIGGVLPQASAVAPVPEPRPIALFSIAMFCAVVWVVGRSIWERK